MKQLCACAVFCICAVAVTTVASAQVLERLNDYGLTGFWHQTKPISDNEYIIVAGSGTLICWNVEERTFVKQSVLQCRALTSFTSANGNWYLGTDNGAILASGNRGETWDEVGNVGAWISDLQAIGGTVYGISYSGDVFIYDELTGKLNIALQRQDRQFTCLDVNGPVITVAGTKGVIVQSQDGGTNWETLQSDTANRITAICRVDDTTLVFGGTATRLWTSDDNGRTMAHRTVLSWMYYTEEGIPGVKYDPINSIIYYHNKLMAVGSMPTRLGLLPRYGIYVSTNSGKYWKQYELPETPIELPVRFQIAGAILPRPNGSVYVVEPGWDEPGSVRISWLAPDLTPSVDTMFFQQNLMFTEKTSNLQKSGSEAVAGAYQWQNNQLHRLIFTDADPDVYGEGHRLTVIQNSTDRGLSWTTTGELVTPQRIKWWHVATDRIYLCAGLRENKGIPDRVAMSTDGGATFTFSPSLPRLMESAVGDEQGRQLVMFCRNNDTVGQEIQKGMLFDLQPDGTCTRIELPKLAQRFSINTPLVYNDSLYVPVWEVDTSGKVIHSWIISNSLPLTTWNIRSIPFSFENLKPFYQMGIWAVTKRYIYLNSGELRVATYDLETETVTEENVWPEIDLTDPWTTTRYFDLFTATDNYLFYSLGRILRMRSKSETQWHTVSRCSDGAPPSGSIGAIIPMDSVSMFIGCSYAMYWLRLDGTNTSVAERPLPVNEVRGVVLRHSQPVDLHPSTINATLYTANGEAVAATARNGNTNTEFRVPFAASGVYYLVEVTNNEHLVTRVMIMP